MNYAEKRAMNHIMSYVVIGCVTDRAMNRRSDSRQRPATIVGLHRNNAHRCKRIANCQRS
jgi:hypothetical protein